jgi:hypothetical protein
MDSTYLLGDVDANEERYGRQRADQRSDLSVLCPIAPFRE